VNVNPDLGTVSTLPGNRIDEAVEVQKKLSTIHTQPGKYNPDLAIHVP
jgi:hypothetical protein